MAATDRLTAVSVASRHIPDACRLVAEAGWNQVPADWSIFVQSGAAIGFEDTDGALVASAAAIPYGPEFGWTSMVLVTRSWRRQGLATELLNRCIENHESAGRVPILDATPAGEAIYRNLGFKGDEIITRWHRPAVGQNSADQNPLVPMTETDIDTMVRCDRRVFGGDRDFVVRNMAARIDARNWCLPDGTAHVLTRAGRVARQVGPLLAVTEASALKLVAAAISRLAEPLLIDVPDRHQAIGAFLAQSGFGRQRPFRRMQRGRSSGFGDMRRMFAIAGPEFG